MAIAGGLVFVALVVMTIVSIIGRKLFSAPVPGDVELLQICAARGELDVLRLLPPGRRRREGRLLHAEPAGPAVVQWLDAVGSLLVGVFGALIAWRTAAATLTLKDSGERDDDPRPGRSGGDRC